MMSLNVKEQVIVGIVAVLLIGIVFGFFLIKPQYSRLSNARSAQEAELGSQQAKESELATLKANKSDAALTEAKSLSLSRKMPEEADLPSVLVELDNLGEETNIKVLDITPSPTTPASGYSVLPIDIKAVGTFFNVSDFLYKLVKMPREYTVGDVSLEVSEQGYPLLSASIKIMTFVYTPNSVASTGSAGQAGSAQSTPPASGPGSTTTTGSQ